MKINFFKSFLSLSFLLAFLSSCDGDKSIKDSNSEKFKDYISGYSSGLISKKDEIRIELNKDIDANGIDWDAIKDDLFLITPKVEGDIDLVDSKTIVFVPKEWLAPNQKYLLTLDLSKLFKAVPEKLKKFNFSVDVLPRDFDFEFKGVRVDQGSPGSVKILGGINFSDTELLENVKKLLSAVYDGNEVKIKWIEGNSRYFDFEISGIKRKEDLSTVVISWDGKPINVDTKGKYEAEVPALGVFSLLSAKVETVPDYYLSLNFSDQVDKKQTLDGLISISGMSDLRFAVVKNEVKVYLPNDLDLNKKVKISEGLKNIFGRKLSETIETDVIAEQIKPEIRFVGNGSILPSSEGLILPFEAVCLKSVDVRITKIYSNNVLQFFQVNNYSGDYQLRRVGKVVLKKVVPLNTDPSLNLHKWNRFVLKLDDLIKKEPGAIYRVELNCRRHQALYTCDDEVSNVNEGSSSYWNQFENYNYGRYNWSQRNNPCHDMYYGYNKVRSKNVLASDIGLVAKRESDNNYTFFVNNLKTTRSIAGAKIKFYNYQQQVYKEIVTDSEGQVKLQLKEVPFLLAAEYEGQTTYMKLRDGSSLSLSSFEVGGEFVQTGIKGFLYGERGVWRPGDSLFISLIVEDKYKNLPEGQPVVFKLKNPRGQTVDKQVISTGVNNMFVFRTKTADDAPTGQWRVEANVGGSSFYKNLKVETIKPNRLKINLDFGKDELISDDKDLDGKLNVKWLHGSPGANLKAEFSLKLKRGKVSYPKFADYVFDNPHLNFYSQEETVFEGKTDADGNAELSTSIQLAEQVPGQLQAVFNGKVYEPSGNYSVSYQSIPMKPYQSMVGVHVEGTENRSGFIETDVKHNVNLVCLDDKGKLVDREDVEVKLYKLSWRWWWDYDAGRSNYNRAQERDLISSDKVNLTGGKGSWSFKVDYPSWGRYLVEVKDPVSGKITGKIFYIDWPYWRGTSNKGSGEGASMLQLLADKEKYNIGDDVKIKVPTAEGGNVLVSLESGSRILKTFWVKSEGKMTTISFPVDKSMTPNIYASIMVLQPHMQTQNDRPIRMYGVLPIFVEDQLSHLSPVINMPKEIEPLQNVTIDISEKKGMPMTFTVAVVDEGLLDLTNFKTPKPWKHFYAKEALGVTTYDMYDEVIGAFGGSLQHLLALGGDMSKKGEKDNKAKRFKPVVKFFGPYTVAKGKTKSVSFKMPNYVGSVRTMVVAGQDLSYGSSEQTTPVRQPLMVLATVPRVVGPGEVVDIPVSIFATDKTIKKADIQIQTNDIIEVLGVKSSSVSFDKPGEKMVYFKVKAKKRLGSGKITIAGNGNGKKATQEIDFEVRTPNPELVKVYDKVLKPGDSWAQAVNNIGLEGTNDLLVEVSSIPSINLEERLSYLIQYPHGCVEQTTSSVFPQLYLSEVMDLSVKLQNKIKDNVQKGVNRLRTFTTSSGGLSYWPGGYEANEWGTIYATHFLVLAKKKGYNVPDEFLKPILRFLKNKARRFSRGRQYQKFQQAYRLYLLALAGEEELSSMNRLAESKSLNYQTSLRLASAYAILNKTTMADKLLSTAPAEQTTDNEWRWYTYGSALRDNAMTLETFVLLNKQEEGFDLLRRMSEKLGSNYWCSTQTTAFCIYAYVKYVSQFSKSSSIKLNTVFDGDKKQLFGQKTMIKKSFDPSERVNHQFDFTNQGQSLVYVRVYSKGTPLEVSRENVQKKINLSVKYKDMKGNLIDKSNIKQGTEFKVELSVYNNGNYGAFKDLALTQIIPSGWEIRNTRLNEGETSVDAKVEHVDLRDDRINLYFDLGRGQRKTFEFELHSTFTGSFDLPPVVCTAMYDGSIYAQVPGGKTSVTK